MMRVLLDTHALLWWVFDDPRLTARAREVIGDVRNDVLVSAATGWEIAIKHRLGKLSGADELIRRFDELLAADGFLDLPIRRAHALRAGGLDHPHRDPFDRMLAAQSMLEGVPLVSADPVMARLGADVLW
jgi:PIN domain nuclease of toxin-antitoxin system